MTKSALELFDLTLCEYARQNLVLAMQCDGIPAHLQRLPPEFREYLLNGPNVESPFADNGAGLTRLLTNDELRRMGSLADVLRPFVSPVRWRPYQELHDDVSRCTKQIRDRLTMCEAEEWSRKARSLLAQLTETIPLSEGLEVVSELVLELRRWKEIVDTPSAEGAESSNESKNGTATNPKKSSPWSTADEDPPGDYLGLMIVDGIHLTRESYEKERVTLTSEQVKLMNQLLRARESFVDCGKGDAVHQRIKRLRHKLKPFQIDIENVRANGYRLIKRKTED